MNLRSQTGSVKTDAERRELLARIGRVRRRLDRRATRIKDRALMFGLLRLTESRSRGLSLLATIAAGSVLAGHIARLWRSTGGSSLLSFWQDLLRLFPHFRDRAASTENSRPTTGDGADSETNDG